MITYINTDEMNDIARELSSMTNDLESEFNTIFKRFSNVPNVTKEWIGNNADYYFSTTNEDKSSYDNLIKQLRSFSQELTSEASNVERQIRANNNKD